MSVNTLRKEMTAQDEAVVEIHNRGDFHFILWHNKVAYIIPPHGKLPVAQHKAKLWLGDPDLRESDPEAWVKMVERLRARYGGDSEYGRRGAPVNGRRHTLPTKNGPKELLLPPDLWTYIQEGNIFCPDFGDLAATAYAPPEDLPTQVVEGHSMQEYAAVVGTQFLHPPDPSILDQQPVVPAATQPLPAAPAGGRKAKSSLEDLVAGGS